MPIAKITGQGLATIACSVGLLWGCVIAQHIAQREALTERTRVIREVRQFRERRAMPAFDPSPLVHRRPQLTAG